MYLLIIFEALTILAICLFVGIMESKYYQKISIDGSGFVVNVLITLLLLLIFGKGLLETETLPSWFPSFYKAAHCLLQLFSVLFINYLIRIFFLTQFKYARQYLFARAALISSIVLQFAAVMYLFEIL